MNARFIHPSHPHIVAHNSFEIIGDTVRMELTQGEYVVFDIGYLPLVAQHRWCAATFRWRTYAITQVRDVRGRQQSLRMHRLIMGITDPEVLIDHRSFDGLDNRRNNLREADRSQNAWNCSRPRRNTSGFKGVSHDAKSGKYTVAIKVDGKQLYLGRYDDPVEAAHAYDEAARQHHGEFARTNF